MAYHRGSRCRYGRGPSSRSSPAVRGVGGWVLRGCGPSRGDPGIGTAARPIRRASMEVSLWAWAHPG